MKLTCCIPENTSKEKVQLLRILGVEVILCKIVGKNDPEHFQNVAKRIAKERNIYYSDQFYNEVERKSVV